MRHPSLDIKIDADDPGLIGYIKLRCFWDKQDCANWTLSSIIYHSLCNSKFQQGYTVVPNSLW